MCGKNHNLHEGLEVLSDQSSLVPNHVVSFDLWYVETGVAEAIQSDLEFLGIFGLVAVEHCVGPEVLDDA